MTSLTFTLELNNDLAVPVVSALLKAMERATAATATPSATPVSSAQQSKSNWTEAELTAWLRKLSPVQRAIALKVAAKAQTADAVATTDELLAVAAAAANNPEFSAAQLAAAYSWLQKFALKVRGTAWPATFTSKGLTMDKSVAATLLQISQTVI